MTDTRTPSCPDDVTLVDALLEESAGRHTPAIAHASTCSRCTARAADFRETLRLARFDALDVPVSAPTGLEDAILSTIRMEALGATPSVGKDDRAATREVRERPVTPAPVHRPVAAHPRWLPLRISVGWAAAVLAITVAGGLGLMHRIWHRSVDEGVTLTQGSTPPKTSEFAQSPLNAGGAAISDTTGGDAEQELVASTAAPAVGEWTTWDETTVRDVGALAQSELDQLRARQVESSNVNTAVDQGDALSGLENLTPAETNWLLGQIEQRMGG